MDLKLLGSLLFHALHIKMMQYCYVTTPSCGGSQPLLHFVFQPSSSEKHQAT